MFAEVEDGRLYYVERGAGPPLLVHHGGPGFDHTSIAPFLKGLERRRRVVYFDHRGTGRSSRPAGRGAYDMERFVQDVDGLRCNLGLDRFSLLGHSFGGIVAQHYALEHARRLSSLVLVCAAASHEFLSEGLARAPSVVGPAAWGELEGISRRPPSAAGMRRACELQARVFFLDPAAIARLDLDRVRWGPASQAAWEYLSGFDLRPRLAGVEMPALVVAGRHDLAIPVRYGEELARLIPGARLEVSERSAHFPFVEDQEWFVDVVSGFLDSAGT